MVKRKYSAVRTVTTGNFYGKAVPRKRMKMTYKKKPVYKAKSVARKGVASLVSKKHIKTGKKAPKVSAKLTRSIKLIAQKEALKDKTIYDSKETFCGYLTSPLSNAQVNTITWQGGSASVSGQLTNSFTMMDMAEISALCNAAYTITDTAALPLKLNVIYAKKTWTITNNTFAFLDFTAIEYVHKTDTSSSPLTLWSTALAGMPAIPTKTNAITDYNGRPMDHDTWRGQFKTKSTNFSLAPGGSYSTTLYCSNVDIDGADWETNNKRGITKGVMFIYAVHQVGYGTGGNDSFQAGLGTTDSTAVQITVRQDGHYKITAPDQASEALTFDKQFRGVTCPTQAGTNISIFDRSGLALAATT